MGEEVVWVVVIVDLVVEYYVVFVGFGVFDYFVLFELVDVYLDVDGG